MVRTNTEPGENSGPTPDPEQPAAGEPPKIAAPSEEATEQDKKTEAAKDFLRAALAQGPHESAKVMAEGIKQGHARRTLDRARNLLNVKRWVEGYHGVWWMALKDDPAVATVEQQRKQKRQAAADRAGNGRKRRKNGGGRKPRDKLLAPLR